MRIRDHFLNFIRSVLMGIASVIPFISISSLAITLGLYDLITNTITSLFYDLKKNTVILFHIVLGVTLGIISGINLIDFAFKHAKAQTIFLFIGLIIGGIYLIFINNKITIKNKKGLLIIGIIFIISLITYYFTKDISLSILNPNNFLNVIYIILISVLLGICLFIPGIGVVAVNILKDYYGIIYKLNKANVVLGVLIIFGILLGTLIVSKIIVIIKKKHDNIFNYMIVSLMLVSIFIAVINIDKFKFNFINISTSLLALFWGFMLAKNLIKE